MSQEITVKDIRMAATFTSYVSLVAILLYLVSMLSWFPEFYESPVAMIGFLITLLAVLWNGKVDGVAGFVERAEKAGVSLEKSN